MPRTGNDAEKAATGANAAAAAAAAASCIYMGDSPYLVRWGNRDGSRQWAQLAGARDSQQRRQVRWRSGWFSRPRVSTREAAWSVRAQAAQHLSGAHAR